MNKLRTLLIVLLISTLNIASSLAQDLYEYNAKVTTFGAIPLNKVKIETTKTGSVAYTDSLGKFSIKYSEKDALVFRASGFDDIKIKSKKLDSRFIDLIYSNTKTSLEEAIAGGHIRRDIIEDAVQNYPLKGDKDYSRFNTIFELIDTEIFNVKVSGTRVETLKPNSFTHSQQVLYDVDGTIVNDISFIVPSDVKSIRYVDGTQAAIYGSRGANGAIQIKLKKK